LPFGAADAGSPPLRARPGDKESPLSVEALVRVASLLLEEQIGVVWVEGEISNLRTPSSGHVYLVLKDERAQLPAVLWRQTASRLRFRLEEGKRFLVHGKLGIYPEQGKFQLYVDAIEPQGVGAAALALEQLKQRLAAEGLFALERKRALPRLPRRIGVVTSPTGAAVKDILRVIERRFPTPVLISPTRVQGEGAPAEIVSALVALGEIPDVDVIIVGRGGGSAEDLSAFNDEAVVRAIFACPVPVISAVGHEIDVTLADLVADVRAATPTAAGELAVPEKRVLVAELHSLETRLAREARVALAQFAARLDRLVARLPSPTRRLERERQRLDEALFEAGDALKLRLAARRRIATELELRLAALHPHTQIHGDRARLLHTVDRARAALRASLAKRRHAFEALAGRLHALSPLQVLDRGYALARRKDGTVVTRADSVSVGEELVVRVAQGELEVHVDKTRPDRPRGSS
jgi:exodeoxyribonuclease VII large subunit